MTPTIVVIGTKSSISLPVTLATLVISDSVLIPIPINSTSNKVSDKQIYILYKWNTTNLSEGYYDLKLEVRSIDYLSRDTSIIYLKNKNIESDVKISIIQPMKNVLYLWGIPIPILFKETVIIGNITILASVNYLKPINRIELYIDDEIKHVDLNNFEKALIQWNWHERVLFKHYIKIIVYDNDGLISSEEMEVWIFNL